jgi:hypothetical protein
LFDWLLPEVLLRTFGRKRDKISTQKIAQSRHAKHSLHREKIPSGPSNREEEMASIRKLTTRPRFAQRPSEERVRFTEEQRLKADRAVYAPSAPPRHKGKPIAAEEIADALGARPIAAADKPNR